MALSNHDQRRIRQYLLGQLNEPEQQKVEERLMVEDDFFQEFEVLKGELVEEYRAGELRPTERSSFEQRFLATSEGRQTHIFAAAVGCLSPATTTRRNPTLVERLRDLVTQRSWALAVPTVAAIVLLVVALLFIMPGDRSQSSISIALTSSAGTRTTGGAGYQRVAITSDVGELKASLELPEPPPGQVTYRAVLNDRMNTKPVEVAGHDGKSVSVVIPAELLAQGLYSLTLYSVSPDRTEQRVPGEYVFEVTN